MHTAETHTDESRIIGHPCGLLHFHSRSFRVLVNDSLTNMSVARIVIRCANKLPFVFSAFPDDVSSVLNVDNAIPPPLKVINIFDDGPTGHGRVKPVSSNL